MNWSQTLTQLFQPKTNNRDLRSGKSIQRDQTRRKTRFAERDFVQRGKTYWKLVPSDVQNAVSVTSFKKKLISREVFKHDHWYNCLMIPCVSNFCKYTYFRHESKIPINFIICVIIFANIIIVKVDRSRNY